MTFTFDPSASDFADEAAVRNELSNAFSVCGECRRCLDRCESFPTLFEALDAVDGDAGLMTPLQQDAVVDGCVQCGLCTSSCPYGPGNDAAELDFARMMQRATTMRRENGHRTRADRIAARTLGRPFWIGRLAARAPGMASRTIAAAPGSRVRRVLQRVVSLDSRRLVSPFAEVRFSSWFEHRPRIRLRRSQRRVAIVPTCVVEFQAPSIGRDLVRVFERNGIECSLAGVRCCGAPLLHAGDMDGFAKVADANTAVLSREVAAGNDIVVPQPGCLAAIRREYVDHVSESRRSDAAVVAEHVAGPSEYLMRIHRSDDAVLDTDFRWSPRRVTLHAASPLRAMGAAFESRDLLRLTGARVEMVQQSSGIEGVWGLRADNEAGHEMAERFGQRMASSTAEVLAGDCHLSNNVAEEASGRRSMHPIELIARAYGIPVEG